MKIKERYVKNVAVLTISGNMMGGAETTALHDKVKSLIADGIKNVVIDLKGVKWMNSSGLGVLMSCFGSLSQVGGKMKLASIAEKVQSVLMITKMIKFFETYDTADRAVAAFQQEEGQ